MASHKDKDDVYVPSVPAHELKAALEKTKNAEAEMVRLIALTMKDNCNIQVPVARGFKFYHVGPLGVSPQMPLTWATKIVSPKKQATGRIRPPVIWHLAPDPRPKNFKQQSFVRDGRTFFTDTYAPPKGLTVNGRELHHSISQAIHFISRVLKTREGIHRFITEFDTRGEVAAWGNYVMIQKEAEERDALGVAGRGAAVV